MGVLLKSTKRRQVGDQIVEAEAERRQFGFDNGLMIFDESEAELVKEMEAWTKKQAAANNGKQARFIGPFRDDPDDKPKGLTAIQKAAMAQEDQREKTSDERATEAELVARLATEDKERLEKELATLKAKLSGGKGG